MLSTPNILQDILTDSDIQCRWMRIGPDEARKMLARNDGNRKIRRGRVKRYARALREGRWLPTGDAICFGVDGKLLNGQHRLLAVVESGVEIFSIVAFGLPPESFKVMDRGATRDPGDLAHIAGFPKPVAKRAAAMSRRALDLLYVWSGRTTDFVSCSLTLDADVIVDWMVANEADVLKSVAFFDSLRTMRRSEVGAFHFAVGAQNQAFVEDAFRRADTGLNITSRDDPAWHLRHLYDSPNFRHRASNKAMFLISKLLFKSFRGEAVRTLRKAENEKLPKVPPGCRFDTLDDGLLNSLKAASR